MNSPHATRNSFGDAGPFSPPVQRRESTVERAQEPQARQGRTASIGRRPSLARTWQSFTSWSFTGQEDTPTPYNASLTGDGRTRASVSTNGESIEPIVIPDMPRQPPKARTASAPTVPRRASLSQRVSQFRSWSFSGPNNAANVTAELADSVVVKPVPVEDSKTTLARSMRRGSVSSIGYYVKKPTAMAMPLGGNDQKVIDEFMELAKENAAKFHRKKFHSKAFQISWFTLLILIIYFGLIGRPLWNGAIYSIWHYVSAASHIELGFLIFFGWGASIAWLPLLFGRFEKHVDDPENRDASETCLLIPAYKAAGALPATIEHALKIFKPNQIFIIANGNSPTPLDDTQDVCRKYRVNHAWVPIGSKIAAEFVGVMLAKKFKYAMLIDDDVHLPPNLPIVTDRFDEHTKCIGYSIKSTGADGCRGTAIQQCQDIEYKLSGLSRTFGGMYGSAVFPHGAIILWDRAILEQLFWGHPGYKISEDWYFGHTCRSAGYRIKFCTQVFVETETPPSLFLPAKSTRGGYGEMTVWKQRFYRWNFFYIYRLWHDFNYLLFAWRLGRHELITKLYIINEVWSTFVYTIKPIMLPIAYVAQPKMAGIISLGLIGVYISAVIFFNATHLRRKKEMINWKVFPVYFAMKFALSFVNTVSVYYAIYSYATFFSVRHPRVFEDYAALSAAKECLEKVSAEQNEFAQREKDPADITAMMPDLATPDFGNINYAENRLRNMSVQSMVDPVAVHAQRRASVLHNKSPRDSVTEIEGSSIDAAQTWSRRSSKSRRFSAAPALVTLTEELPDLPSPIKELPTPGVDEVPPPIRTDFKATFAEIERRNNFSWPQRHRNISMTTDTTLVDEVEHIDPTSKDYFGDVVFSAEEEKVDSSRAEPVKKTLETSGQAMIFTTPVYTP